MPYTSGSIAPRAEHAARPSRSRRGLVGCAQDRASCARGLLVPTRLDVELKWDARGLWYWVPAAVMAWSLFVDQPLDLLLKAVSLGLILGTTWALRRRDPGWARRGTNFERAPAEDGPPP